MEENMENIQVVDEQNNVIGYVGYTEANGSRYLRLPNGPSGIPHFFDTYRDAAIQAFAPSVFACDYRVWIYTNNVYRVCTDEEALEH